MPIYEYRCHNCNRRISIFVHGFQESSTPICPQCGSNELTRLFSPFSIGKGESYMRKGVYEDILSDSQLVRGLEQNDPRALAAWNRRMSQAAGEGITPESEEINARLEAGEPIGQVVAEAQSMMGEGGSNRGQ